MQDIAALGLSVDSSKVVQGNAWNLGQPNGQQRADDILAQVLR